MWVVRSGVYSGRLYSTVQYSTVTLVYITRPEITSEPDWHPRPECDQRPSAPLFTVEWEEGETWGDARLESSVYIRLRISTWSWRHSGAVEPRLAAATCTTSLAFLGPPACLNTFNTTTTATTDTVTSSKCTQWCSISHTSVGAVVFTLEPFARLRRLYCKWEIKMKQTENIKGGKMEMSVKWNLRVTGRLLTSKLWGSLADNSVTVS